MYNRKDHYYKKAKEEGFASRAVYKLDQIQTKFKVVRNGDRLLDLGCAPGGWLEILSKLVGKQGVVVGIDILPIKIKCPANVHFVLGDINDENSMNKVMEHVGCGCAARNVERPTSNETSSANDPRSTKVDVIVSDMAPNTSGVAFKDCYLSYELCMMALETAKKVLKEGGNFVAKMFQGEELVTFRAELRKYFKKVDSFTPPATRQESKELYLVALGYHSS